MKKIVITFIATLLITLGVRAQTTSVTVAWDRNPETDIALYQVYYSTNNFLSVSNIVGAGTNLTATVPVKNNVLYSVYVTAKNTAGLESDRLTILYYSQFNIKPNVPSNLILSGTNNWSGATVVRTPTNGVIAGTLPNLTYTLTNLTAVADSISYKINTGTNSLPNFYYHVEFIFPNSPPNIRINL